MFKKAFLFTCVLLLTAPASPAHALTGKDIAHRSQFRPGYERDESTALVMRLVNKKGQVREREFVRFQVSTEKGKKTLMKFATPDDIKDTASLNVEVWGRDDIQYLYLPAANKIRRVSAKTQSWMGSDFNYEDIMEIEFDDYDYEYLGDDVFDGRAVYKYTMVPVSPDKSVYAKQIRWVTKDDYLPVKNEYFNDKGEKIKVVEFTDLKKTNGVMYAWKIEARSLTDGHRTEMDRLWLFLDSGLPESYGTTRHMKKSIDTYDHPEGMWEIWNESRERLNAATP